MSTVEVPTYAPVINLPAPLGAAAPFTTFTDVLGDLWVAIGSAFGGQWKRATNVLSLRVTRNAAFSQTNLANIPFDAVQGNILGVVDPYGMFSSGNGIVLPVTGTWAFSFQATVQATAASQYCVGQLLAGATVLCYGPFATSLANGNYLGSGSSDIWGNRAAGSVMGVQATVSATLNLALGYSRSFLACQYLGTS